MLETRPGRRGTAACAIALFVVIVSSSGCASNTGRVVRSQQLPSQAVLVFPNSVDRESTTAVRSDPQASVAGIKGPVLTISSFYGAKKSADELTIDAAGDVGVRGSIRAEGSISVVSRRSAKTDIVPFSDDPLAIIDATRIVSYAYRSDPTRSRRIGFIAEDTPSALSGRDHDRFDMGNTLAVTMAATQRLQRRVERLERQVRVLQAALRSRPRR
jgi:hypothetical protein